VLAAFRYEGAARRLILNLKLGGNKPCAGPLAQGLAHVVLMRGLLADRVTWVPGRRADIRSRGFDHAAVVARSFAALVGLPAEPLLFRVGKTRDQAALSRLERLSNLDRAFSSAPCEGRIALVDDLLTTGATARACALALHRGGAGEVEVVVAARA
jgi:predicted amidophosphoribosyltransferase